MGERLNRIEIYPQTKVYVAAPAHTATGGPELLHQLVYNLRKHLSVEAYMYYIPEDHPDPVHPAYRSYNNPYTKTIEDEKKNLLIVPEVAYGISTLTNYSKIRKAIWWLSVDNFYISVVLKSKRNFLFRRAINKILKLISKTDFDLFDVKETILKKMKHLDLPKLLSQMCDIDCIDFHLAQSYYAIRHLEEAGIPRNKLFYLSDYLNDEFLKNEVIITNKENVVVFNPKKGFSFTKKLIKHAPEISFIPLVNMTRAQVVKTLQKAKVYIDFGNHPGKDRIPREAAILGCCVITNKRGSAAYFEDVPIPESYKFEDKYENIPKIVETIKECFEYYDQKFNDFEYYRKIIENEPKKFIEDMKNIFKVDL